MQPNINLFTSVRSERVLAYLEFITRQEMADDFKMSDALIEELGAPDKTLQNPGRSIRPAPLRLWRRQRVSQFLEQRATDYVVQMTNYGIELSNQTETMW